MNFEKLRQRIVTKIKALIRDQKDLKPRVKRQANKIVEDMRLLGHPVRITEGYRSMERQAQLYAQGRTAPGPVVTNAKPGDSFHNYGVAVDFTFVEYGYNASLALWETLGNVGKKHGFVWGGDWSGFVDRPHFEMTLGYTLEDFKSNNVDYAKYV